MLDAADIEAIEGTTLQAVAPEVVESMPGWLLPTLTLTGEVQRMLALHAGPPADLDRQADAGWLAVYLGESLDPVDAASRSRLLSRASGTLFASVREEGRTVACGAASLSHGWLGVHGMRTVAARHGQGLALRALAPPAQGLIWVKSARSPQAHAGRTA